MGDRVVVVLSEDGETPFFAAVYHHWAGEGMVSLLEKAAPRMRRRDASYALARLIGVSHEGLYGALSLGVIEAPMNLDHETLVKASHGDAGVIVVNLLAGKYYSVGGYLEEMDIGRGTLNLSNE